MERIRDEELTAKQVQGIAGEMVKSIQKLVQQDDSNANKMLFEIAGLIRRMTVIQVSKLDSMQEKLTDLERQINALREQQPE